jgi:4-hydroxy-2-oxoheptanedioate aldolase
MDRDDIRTGRALRRRLHAGEPLAGCFQRIPAPTVTELIAASGFDFVVLDMEHTPVSLERIGDLVRAAEAFGLPPLVRVPSHDPVGIARALETGCVGIHVPLVRSAPEAEAIVAATRYAPAGTRGLAAPRQIAYGTAMPVGDWVRASHDSVLVVVQVEDRLGVAEAGAIAGVDGVDVVFVGLADLSTDLGVPGELAHPSVTAAVESVASVARVTGAPARDADAAAALRAQGVAYVTTDDVRCLLRGAAAFLGPSAAS